MRELTIWKIILWTMLATAVVMLLMSRDSGFLRLTVQAIPVSTGERIEVVVSDMASVSGVSETTLYWLESDGTFEKKRTFRETPQCITGYDGYLFMTFGDGNSSIFKDAEWVRSVSKPGELDIIDVAPFGGVVYAFGMANDSKSIGVRRLDEKGWTKPAEPFESDRETHFAGCINVDGGIEVLYARIREGAAKRPKPSDLEWGHVLFDGSSWGTAEPLSLPENTRPSISSYGGRLALVLSAVEGGKVTVALVDSGRLDMKLSMPLDKKSALSSAWLVPLDGRQHLMLSTAKSVWDIPVDDWTLGEHKELLAISGASRARSSLYVALLAIATVMFMSLGSAWLFVKLRKIRQSGERRQDGGMV